jgi:membrane protease YdiL (CAAX protease family)
MRIRHRPLLAAFSALALALGVCVGSVAVARTEAGEQDVEAALAGRGDVGVSAQVAAGARVLVEVCSVDAEHAAAPVAAIVEAPSEGAETEIVAVVTIGAATLDTARRAGSRACWTPYEQVAPRAGRVRVRLADAEGAAALRVTGSIHVRDARCAAARPALWLAFFGALGLASALALRPSSSSAELSVLPRGRALLALLAGVAGAAAVAEAVRYVGDGGALHGLTRGLLLGAAELGLALGLAAWLVRRAEVSLAGVLGAVPPRGGAISLLSTPAVGAACAVTAVFALRFFPSPPGEVPIEAFVARPSGMLAFALLAVVVPVAEELFFRGFVYGTARRALGAPAAFVLSAGLFFAAHAPQDWGSVGGLLSVALIALATTTLRAATGSVATAMLAHLVYNGLLTASAM